MRAELASPSANSGSRPVSLKSIALPVEHGGWGFVGEPLIVGLLVAPSGHGLLLALAAVAAFLTRHPLKLILADGLRGRIYPRTRSATGFALLYGSAGAAALVTGIGGQPLRVWTPILVAAPFALIQLGCDVRNRGRELAPELLGAVAAGSMAAAIAMAGGWPAGRAIVLWVLLALRAAASIVYVRTRLRLDRGLRPDRRPAWLFHGAGLLVAAVLVQADLAPWLAAIAFAALLGRAVHGLSARRQPVRPQRLGFQELGYGLLTAALLAIGYAF